MRHCIHLALLLSVSASTISLLGCGDDPVNPARPAPPPPIVWGACPETYEGAECATIPMPLDHDHPDGETIPIFVARQLSGAPNAAQLWLLNGGPGSSDEDFFLGLGGRFAQAMPGVDLYFPDHRGTGRSAGLVCSGEAAGSPKDVELSPEEWASCIAEVSSQWGDKLASFNTTNAAKDLGQIIERARAPEQQVFVYGLSYGTYLGLRYLDFYPDQSAGIILDSFVSPGSIYISKADQYFDQPARAYAGLCKADATCSAKMGPDPWARLEAIFAEIDAGHCAEAAIDRPTLRYILAASLLSWRLRVMSLALPYRLDRCSAEDQAAIASFKEIFFSPYELIGFSHALESNISFSELWESPPPTAEELEARADGALYSLDWAAERAAVYPAWPRYTSDAYALAWPEVTIPMLILNGTLDGETPIDTARVAKSHYGGPHQTFVELPNSPHGAGYQSPTTLPDGLPCGITIMGSFVKDPEAPPDTSCIAAMKPVVFEDAAFAGIFFGTGSVWENDPPARLWHRPPAGRRRMFGPAAE